MANTKRKPVRLAERPGPERELEEAMERRLDDLFVASVEAHLGRRLSADDREALLDRTRWREEDYTEQNKEGQWVKKDMVLPKDLYDDLGQGGVLSSQELRDLEREQRARQGDRAHGYGASLPADAPTEAAPGSEEKIAVMRGRLKKGQSLHHPGDRKLPAGVFAAGLLSRGEPGEEGGSDGTAA